MAALEELVLLPEVQARRQLRGRIASFCVLSPLGNYAGVGTLRVLRITERNAGHPEEPFDSHSLAQDRLRDGLDIIAGYESYDRIG